MPLSMATLPSHLGRNVTRFPKGERYTGKDLRPSRTIKKKLSL